MRRTTGLVCLMAVAVAACVPSAEDPGTTPPTTGAPPTTTPIQDRTDTKDVSQVLVPAGCFIMGTTDEQADYARSLDGPDWATRRIVTEQPDREVCITNDYWIDAFEVTNRSFQEFVDAGGYDDESHWSADGLAWLADQDRASLPVACDGGPDHPRVCVTWYEAEAYASWRGGRLPTEAEWEYAARGSDSLIFPWGNEWDATLANVIDSDGLSPVGSFATGVSWVRAHDMAGNAMEWVSDWLSTSYSALLDQTQDPTGVESGRIKIEKGGWSGSNAVVTRSAYRHFEDPPTYQDGHIGFRVVTPG